MLAVLTRPASPQGTGCCDGIGPKVEAQLGNLRLNVLLDTGSIRCLISLDYFQNMPRANPKLQIHETEVTCATASGQKLGIVGEVQVPFKIRDIDVFG